MDVDAVKLVAAAVVCGWAVVRVCVVLFSPDR
jgi:hypothetical protein